MFLSIRCILSPTPRSLNVFRFHWFNAYKTIWCFLIITANNKFTGFLIKEKWIEQVWAVSSFVMCTSFSQIFFTIKSAVSVTLIVTFSNLFFRLKSAKREQRRFAIHNNTFVRCGYIFVIRSTRRLVYASDF